LGTESLFAPAVHVRYTVAQLIGRPREKAVDPHCWHPWEDPGFGPPSTPCGVYARQSTVLVDGRGRRDVAAERCFES
jgi:hypothetical protein